MSTFQIKDLMIKVLPAWEGGGAEFLGECTQCTNCTACSEAITDVGPGGPCRCTLGCSRPCTWCSSPGTRPRQCLEVTECAACTGGCTATNCTNCTGCSEVAPTFCTNCTEACTLHIRTRCEPCTKFCTKDCTEANQHCTFCSRPSYRPSAQSDLSILKEQLQKQLAEIEELEKTAGAQKQATKKG